MAVLTSLLLGGLATSILARRKFRKKDRKQAEKRDMSRAEKVAAHHQEIALTTVSLIGLGGVILPVITISAIPLLGYSYFHILNDLRRRYREKKKIAALIYETSGVTLTLLLGSLLLGAILFSIVFSTRRLIAKTERDAHTDFSNIFGELSNTAWLLKDGVEIEVPLESLKIGDVIVLHAGEMAPVDGRIVKGEGMIDHHLLTGEAQSVERAVGDVVLTSTLLISGVLHIEVEKKGEDTIAGQIASTLEHAAMFKHAMQSRGERLSEKGAVRTLLAVALVTPFIGLYRAAPLTWSGFGYQMRVAAPLMVLNYLRVASRNGILIKDGRALDVLHQVDTVVFDKTGTLTEEVPQIGDLIACDGISETRLLQYTASAEQRQKHPIAQAICQYAKDKGVSLLELAHSDYMIGHGLRADLIDPEQEQPQQTILIGSENFVRKAGMEIPEPIQNRQAGAGEKGYSMVYIASGDKQLMGVIELRPALRAQAQDAVAALKALDIALYIISGDQEKPTRHLAERLGVDHYFAETLPADKARIIAELQEEGRKVCFVGDGINDSVALQQADVSISLHGAATIAQDVAEIVLMSRELTHLPYLVRMSRELDMRMNRSEWLNMAFGSACVIGVLVFSIGISTAAMLYFSGLLINLINGMLVLIPGLGANSVYPPRYLEHHGDSHR